MKRSFIPAFAVVALGTGCHGERASIAQPPPPDALPLTAPTADAPSTMAAPIAAPSAPRGVGKRIAEVRIVDDTRFWIVADGRAFETHDGGQSFVDRTPFKAPAEGESDARAPSWSAGRD